MARIQAFEGSPLDDTDEFEYGPLDVMERFMFEPVDEHLLSRMRTELEEEGYSVIGIEVINHAIEVSIKCVCPDSTMIIKLAV